jgi:hypothetical protein
MNEQTVTIRDTLDLSLHRAGIGIDIDLRVGNRSGGVFGQRGGPV